MQVIIIMFILLRIFLGFLCKISY